MPEFLQLESFDLVQLGIDWIDSVSGEQPVQYSLDLSPSSMPISDDEREFMLGLKMNVRGMTGEKTAGYQITAKLRGRFLFPEGFTPEQMKTIGLLNGSAILYQLLRGQIATISGTFPGGKFTLPTVYMPEYIPTFLESDVDNDDTEPKTKAQELPHRPHSGHRTQKRESGKLYSKKKK